MGNSINVADTSTRQRPPWTPANRGMESPKNVYPTIQKSPLIDPPDASWPFIPNGTISMPDIGSGPQVICGISVPQDKAGVIWKIANGTALGSGISGWVIGDGNLVWQIVRNGQAVQYFNNITTIIGLNEQGGSELVAPIRIAPGDNIALVVSNLGVPASGQKLIGLLSGFLFPRNQQPEASR